MLRGATRERQRRGCGLTSPPHRLQPPLPSPSQHTATRMAARSLQLCDSGASFTITINQKSRMTALCLQSQVSYSVHRNQGAGGGGRESLQPPPVVGMGVGMEAKEGLRQVGPRVKREAGGEKTGPERREGQRQVGPHVKGAGAGSYYLLGSRCPPVSPGSAGSSVTEHRVGSIRAGAPAPRGA